MQLNYSCRQLLMILNIINMQVNDENKYVLTNLTTWPPQLIPAANKD